MRFRYALSSPKAREKAKEVAESMYYLSERITAVRVGETELEVDYEGDDEEAFRRKAERFLHDNLKIRLIPRKTLKDNRTAKPPRPCREQAPLAPVGSLRLTGDAALAEQALDRLFFDMAAGYGAQMRRYPSFMTMEHMMRSGYMYHYPQNVYGVSEVEHEQETLERCRSHLSEEQPLGGLMRHNELYLQPCVCYHVYAELAAERRKPGKLELFSAAGPCYRHEHRSRLSPVRVREFRMREIVFLGEEQPVEQMRATLVEDSWALFERLGLRGYLETATDPFYFHDDGAMLFYQQSGALKYELRVTPDDQTGAAITSFNLCGSLLCQSFGIDDGSHTFQSGCVGFGIDRWVQALLMTHGPVIKEWPQTVRETLFPIPSSGRHQGERPLIGGARAYRPH
ncbi:aminoacyl--tRNA ligase-related protein [Paenibacillus elgii]|uniref:aminoacyl--tRNA ligase-related protein n=1 Tax=Paenibacillus elgii TaxID=189691 RepID=UPI0013D627F3|nr:aminoacyl--tRNA ligase-related protein [Paenibacillus elgii]